MNKYSRFFQILFVIPWIVFGIQHFMYAEFVATLVPSFIPFKLFWTYFTGAAMIAAGISLIANKLSAYAALLLGLMLIGFIALIHVSVVSANPFEAKIWTRPEQDIALAAACLLLANNISQISGKTLIPPPVVKICQYIFALMLIAFGVQQFQNLDFLTAQTPSFLPLQTFWSYLSGAVMIAAGASVLISQKARLVVSLSGIYLLLINSLNYLHLLMNDLHKPTLWTAAMLNLAITVGVFILANSLPADD